jgi:hypothetical protein
MQECFLEINMEREAYFAIMSGFGFLAAAISSINMYILLKDREIRGRVRFLLCSGHGENRQLSDYRIVDLSLPREIFRPAIFIENLSARKMLVSGLELYIAKRSWLIFRNITRVQLQGHFSKEGLPLELDGGGGVYFIGKKLKKELFNGRPLVKLLTNGREISAAIPNDFVVWFSE